MKRTTRFLVVSIFLFLFSACTVRADVLDGESGITLVDGLGRTVSFESPAQRIVSLSPAGTEILFAVGAGGQVVGRDSFSNFPESARSIQDVGGSMGNYSFESIASLQPDMVLLTEINTPEQVKSLEDLGIKVYYLSNPIEMEGLYGMINTIGTLTGHEKEAADLAKSLEKRVEKVLKQVRKAEMTPTVFYELDGTDPAKPWTTGAGTFLDKLIVMAGGQNAGASLQTAWAQISIEELLVSDPDIILLGDSVYGMTPEQVASRPGWDGLTAVKEGKVFGFNDDLVSRPGPRMVDGLEELVKLLHPELK